MKNKIRVMQITDNLGIGGLERVVVNLCTHLNTDIFSVGACCLNFRGSFATELEKKGIPVRIVPSHEPKKDYFLFWRLKDILQKNNPHIIHTHNTNALIDGVLAGLLSRTPAKIHTDHARKFPDKRKYMIAESILSKFIDRIVAVSEETRHNLMRYEKINGNKICVINNGIDAKKYDIKIDERQKIKELNLDKFNHIVGLGVRLTKQKGITYLIKAAPLVLQKFPNTAFIIAGDGQLLDTLKNETKELGVSSNFFFLGPRLDLPEILQILDIYVLPSEWEGLPLVILEAMAARRPIVATNVGGNSTAITDGECGYLVPPMDHTLLADNICKLLADKGKRTLFAKNAHDRFYAEFEVSHMVRKYEKLYAEVLLSKGIRIP